MNSLTETVPSKEDWGDLLGDFDAIDAYANFGGCTRSDAHRLLANDVLARAQDLRFMPHRPFVYYMKAFSDFVLSSNYGNSHPADAADAFLSVVVTRASELRSIREDIEKALVFLVDRQSEFGASSSIYGLFAERSAEIKRLLVDQC
jgi:hypothetical protein